MNSTMGGHTLRLRRDAMYVAHTARIPSGFVRPAPVVAAPPAVSCLNCAAALVGAYCHGCGQAAKTPARITFGAILHELPHALLHLDHALPHTLVALLRRPGHTVRRYLEGKRAHTYSPFALLLLVSGLLGFATMTLKLNAPIVVQGNEEAGRIFTQLLHKYSAWIRLLFVPLQALGPMVVLRRRTGFGYGEQVIAATMIATGGAMVSLAGVPLQWLVRGTVAAEPLKYAIEAGINFYALWAYAQLQDDGRQEGALKRWLRSFAAILASLGFVVLAVVVVVVVVVVVGVLLVKHRI